MASIHCQANPERRIWTLVGLCLTVLYATVVGLAYFVQLFMVIPYVLNSQAGQVEWMLFRPDSLMKALDAFASSLKS